MAEGLVNSCKQGHLEGVKKFLDDGYVDTEFGNGSTTLIMAVKGGSVEVTKPLLSAGARIYHVNRHGKTAFARAVQCEDNTLLNLLRAVIALRGDEMSTAKPLLTMALGSHDSVWLLTSLIEEVGTCRRKTEVVGRPSCIFDSKCYSRSNR